MSQMIRDCSAGRIGPLTTIGTGTFVDPAEGVRLDSSHLFDWCDQGGKKNGITKEDWVQEVKMNGQRLLWYRAPKKIDIALLRGTTADVDGNVSFEREALLLDTLLKVTSG